MFRTTPLYLGTILALASVGAHAATYSYTPVNSATDLWSAGTDWTDGVTTPLVPVSSLDTTLVFGPASNFPDATILTNTNTNDLGTFTLNSLTLQGIGTVTAAFPTSITIASAAGSSLNFVTSSTSVAPTLNLTATNGGSPLSYTVSSPISLGNDLTVTGNGNATFSLSGPISGTANIFKTGSSALTLSGANTYTGNTAINGGTIKISAANNLGDNTQVTNTIELNAGTLESTAGGYDLGVNRVITLNGASSIVSDAGVLTLSGAINNGANLLTINGAGNTTITGVIGGAGTAGGLTKTGAGTLVLGNTNTYTGTTTINGGILNLGFTHALGGQGNITFTGGTLQYSAADLADKSGRIVNSTAPIHIDVNGQTVTYATPLAASNTAGFNLTGTGGGTLVFNAINQYTGTTTVTSGTLKLANTQAIGALTNTFTLAGGTLDLATDTSVSPYNTTITANSTIASDRATAASAGITHTLGTLSLPNNATLTAIAGANVAAGTPAAIAFGPATVTAVGVNNETFTPTTAAILLGSFTGAGPNVSLQLSGTDTVIPSTIGPITAIGSAVVTRSGGSTWQFNGQSTYPGPATTNVNAPVIGTSLGAGITIIGSNSNSIVPGSFTSGPFGTSYVGLSATAAILQGDGTPRSITNPLAFTSNGATIGGSSALDFYGTFLYDVSGTTAMNINNSALTGFHGAWTLSNGTSGRTDFIQGTGNVLIDSAIVPNSLQSATAGNTQNMSFVGTGTLTLANTNGGSISGNSGNVNVTTLTVAGGTRGTGLGDSTLKIKGNYTIGATGSAALIIKGGTAGTGTTTQGTLSLVDGGINTLSINSQTASATVLTMAGATGLSSNLNMEIGDLNASDQIVLGAGLKASIGVGKVNLNITGLGGFASGSAAQNYTLLTAPGAGLTAGGTQFNLATSGNFGGYTTANLASSTTTAVVLSLGGLTPAPTNAYWTGSQGSVWSTLTGGIANNSNWATDATGATGTLQIPSAPSNVFFSASTGANLNTTLGANTSINSLHFTSVGGAVTIGGTNTLTLGAGGLTADTGAAGPTITAPVALGAAQTWTNGSANPITENGVISGANLLTKAGTGTLILGGANTFTGGVAIANGIVQIANAGAFNSTTPQQVSFVSNAPSTADLQLAGTSATIGALVTDATNPGTPIVENASANPATLSISVAAPTTSQSTYAGTLQDGIGGGALSVTKRGVGTEILSGANVYTGATTVGNGRLLINGSLAAGSAVNITANADNRTAVLGGIGTINGPVTVTAPTGTGRLDEITAADIGTTGTLTLTSGLTIGAGGIAYFDIDSTTGDHDFINITSGGLNITSGAQVRVTANLGAGVYDLIGFTGTAPDLTNFTLLNSDGTPASDSYKLNLNGTSNIMQLTITGSATAVPSISISTPINGTRLMMNTANVQVAGIIGNANGGTQLNGTLADGSGDLAVGNFGPSNPVVVPSTSTALYTATVLNTGTTLGNRTFKITVSDPDATPKSATATGTLDVLDNRVVAATPVNYGIVHVNTPVTASTSLTSPGADTQYTRVTVADSTMPDANGISVTGGTNPTFDGTTTDTRTVSGTLATVGPVNGSITLTTTGEGINGEAPINVSQGYTASVFSGKAAWNSAVGASWGTQTNWGDTNVANLGNPGAPGLAGAVISAADTATFGDVAGEGAATTVTLDGSSPILAGINFTSTTNSYTLATGTGNGVYILSGASTPVNLVTGSNATISAVLSGTGTGLHVTGSGALTLTAANTYSGATAVNNGILNLNGGNNRLPASTTLTLGDAVNNGSPKVILGSTGVSNQTLTGLFSAGTGAPSIVGGAATNSLLTVIYGGVSADTYAGNLGGTGTNENNLALTKNGGGTLILSGNNTYTGPTTLTAGPLQAGSLNALAGTSSIVFGGGSLQFSAASAPNGNSYLARFAAGTNINYNIDTNGVTVNMDDNTVGSPFNGAATGAQTTLNKLGAGTLSLTNISAYVVPITNISNGALQTPSGSDFATSFVKLAGTINGNVTSYAVWQTNGTVTKNLAGSGAGNLIWNSWSGFAAAGGPLSVNLNGGAALSWGSGSNFMAAGTAPLAFGSSTADNAVTLQNGFDFGAPTANLSVNFNRVIDVEGARATVGGVGADAYGLSGNHAILAGAITANVPYSLGPPVTGDLGNNGFTKTGPGTLVLAGQNTYSGGTTISGGTLVAGTNALLGVGTAGAFGDGHQVVGATTVNGTQAVTLGAANVNGLDGTTAMGASPTLLIGGPYTVGLPVTIANFATTGNYRIGGSTANPATFSNVITTNQSLLVTQVTGGTLTFSGADSGGASINGSSTSTISANFNGGGNVDVQGTIGGGNLAVIKSGTGTVSFDVTNTYGGDTTITAGNLIANDGGALGLGDTNLQGGTLTLGTGVPLTLNTGDFNWTSGGVLSLDLSTGNQSGGLSTIAFNLTSGNSFVFDFENSGVAGSTYTLATFGTTTFTDPSVFSATNLGSGLTASFSISNGALTVTTAVPEPATVSLWLASAGFFLVGGRKRIKAFLKKA